MSSEKYIGLDVHQATISVAVMVSPDKVDWLFSYINLAKVGVPIP